MSLTDGKNIMVFVETADGAPVNNALEALGKAHELGKANGEEVCAVLIGKDLDDAAEAAAKAGANKVLIVERDEAYQFETWTSVLVNLIKEHQPAIFLAPSTQHGVDLTAAVANALETVAITNVLEIRKDGDDIVFTAPVYGGTVLNDVVVEGFPKIASVRSGAFKKLPPEEATAGSVEKVAVDAAADLRTKIVDVVQEISESVNLEEAEFVVSGGRGMGNKDNFVLVQELADVLGGVVGATRPAVEDEWVPRPHQVGQSGKIVSPKLYVACGISGATQHISGITGSDFIVAINKDEDAPIFEIADVCIVGNVMEVLPLLTAEIKKVIGA